MPKQSVMEQLKALDDQRIKLLEGAKSEAPDEGQHSALEELNALGFNYRIVEGGRAAGSRKGTRQVDPNKPCTICNFQTKPPHDARSHRSQDPKKPFSAKELADLGKSVSLSPSFPDCSALPAGFFYAHCHGHGGKERGLGVAF